MIREASPLRTLWYMGAKTRIVPDFIDSALMDLLPDGGTLLDLCCGTAVVARSVAHRYRVLSNDVQRFSAVVARAHLEGDESWRKTLETLEPLADLGRAYEDNLRLLERLAPRALNLESQLLPAACAELSASKASAS